MIDTAGTSFAIVAFGPAGAAAAAPWRDELTALGRPVWEWYGEPGDALDALEAQVGAARVGWRLLVAGPGADVLRARAVALAGGAVGAEIAERVTDDRQRRVWCAHCGAISVAVGDSVRCAGCGRAVRVSGHLSRRRAAYLGSVG